MKAQIMFFELPKEDRVVNRYTDWGPNHQLMDYLHSRTKCYQCKDGMMFAYAPDSTTHVICHRCGAIKKAPDLSGDFPKRTLADHRELMLFRDGIRWLFPSEYEELTIFSKGLRIDSK